MKKKSEIQIFLAHASEDKPAVFELYDRLKAAGYKPWLDKKDLLPGQLWENEIPKAIEASDFVFACFSQNSVQKQGYVQQEFRLALSSYAQKTPDSIYLIPLRLDDCQIPDLQLPKLGLNLRGIQWVDYWEEDGFEKLERAITHQFGSFEEIPVTEELELKTEKGVDYTKRSEKLSISSRQRLEDIKQNLELLYKKLGQLERELIITNDASTKFLLEEQIKEIRTQINQYEVEEREKESHLVQLEKQKQKFDEVEIKTEKIVDYTKLRELLAEEKWEEANEETSEIMLKVLSKEKQGWIKSEDMETFPCADLHTIDQLWVQASSGHFGFSVQNQIWKDVGGSSESINYEIYRTFGEKVGWYDRDKDHWKYSRSLVFSLDYAQKGHLPRLKFKMVLNTTLLSQLTLSIFSRCETCFSRK